MCKISVIIPVKNGEATLEKCLAAIRNQTVASQIEIIILDSLSTDDSRNIAERFFAKVINVPAGTFDHGLTRNVGMQHAAGDLLYFTVQDACLAANNQLEIMAAHFEDEALQAVVGMQAVPHDRDKNPAQWFKRFSKPQTTYRHFADGSFSKMSLQQQYQYASWDNVNAMYRKSAIERVPFVQTDFGEDWLWAKDALTAKMKIAFDPALVVYHYHHRSFSYSFRVQYIVNYNSFIHFGVYPGPAPFIRPLLTAWYRIWQNGLVNFSDKIYWSFHNLAGLSGNAASHFIFILIGRLFGQRALASSFRFFCRQVPQGNLKKQKYAAIG